jgi:hypothetical protein
MQNNSFRLSDRRVTEHKTQLRANGLANERYLPQLIGKGRTGLSCHLHSIISRAAYRRVGLLGGIGDDFPILVPLVRLGGVCAESFAFADNARAFVGLGVGKLIEKGLNNEKKRNTKEQSGFKRCFIH